MTKYHTLGGLTTDIYFFTVLRAGKSKIKVPVSLVSGESCLPGLQMVAFLLCDQMAGRQREGQREGGRDQKRAREGKSLPLPIRPLTPS